MTIAELHDHIKALEAERATAALWGLGDNASYRDDVAAELHSARAAFVGAAVTEIAVLRASLDGRLYG